MAINVKAALLCATSMSMLWISAAHAQNTQVPAKPKSPPAPPAAEAAEDKPVDGEIVVTGFRASLEQGLAIKKASVAVVDSIVAEDIGKFPTQNIAEALQRLPGVDLVRNGESNEGQRIQLRGLGPEFTLTTFNGAPVRTTSSGNIGSSTRDFNYDIFSSELFGRADVYKTPLAELEEGGVAGVVNLRTPRPFDRKGMHIGYSASANYSDQSRQTVPRGALQFSNTWGNFGISLGIAKSGNKNRRFGYEPTGGFNNEFENLLYNGSANFTPGRTQEGVTLVPSANVNTSGINTFRLDFDDPAASLNGLSRTALRNALVPRLLRVTGTLNDRDRIGASGSIQYKDDRADFSFDLLYARLKDDYQRQILGLAPRNSVLASGGGVSPAVGQASIPASGGDQPAWVPINPNIDANGLLGGTFKNVALQTASTYRRSDTKFLSLSLNGKFRFNDHFSVEGQLGRTNSKADAINITSVLNGLNPNLGAAGVAANRNALHQITYSVSDPFNPSLSTNRDLNSPLLYNQLQLSGNNRIENDTQKNARLIFELKFDNIAGFETKFRFGGSFTESFKEGIQPNIGNSSSLAANPANPLNSVNIGTGGTTLLYGNATEAQKTAYAQSLLTPIAIAGQSQSGIPSSWLNIGRSYLDQLGFDAAARVAPIDLTSSFRVTESVTALFGMVDLVHSDTFRANLGLRYVKTRTSIDNYVTRTVSGVATTSPQTLNGGYSNWLPSVSLAYNVTPKLVVRGLFSETVTRSSLSNIARAYSIPNAGTAFVVAGNPDLKPQRSSGFDATIEWYFNRGGILSLGAFSKIIKDRPTQINQEVAFSTLGLDSSLFTSPLNTGTGVDPNTTFTVSRFVNQDRYIVQGLELSYQQAYRFLPKPFDGLGGIASFTFIPTKTSPWISVNKTTYFLQGIPRYTASGTLYYEKGPLSMRASYTYRSEQFTGSTNNNGLDFQQFNNARSYVDASIGYKFFKWLEVRIDAQNLTNTKTFEFSRSLTGQFGNENVRADQAFQSGRTFTFGIRGSF
jgi:iron complex outermembrane recepter protein